VSDQTAIVQKQLESPAELASRVGVPVASVRYLIKSGQLEHIYISPGKRNPKIPAGSWEKYLANHTLGTHNGPELGEEGMPP